MSATLSFAVRCEPFSARKRTCAMPAVISGDTGRKPPTCVIKRSRKFTLPCNPIGANDSKAAPGRYPVRLLRFLLLVLSVTCAFCYLCFLLVFHSLFDMAIIVANNQALTETNE